MALNDSFGRRIEYLRVSVTDKCNYRCIYCIPAGRRKKSKQRELLTLVELTHLIRVFSEMGVSKVRFTGGEPLVRRNLVQMVRDVNQLPGISDLSLSTNAHLLEKHAVPLREAGVERVNISLDSLDQETFTALTLRGDLARVIRGIDAALAAGMSPVKLNMVVMKGTNDHEIEAMLEFAMARGAELRFIETMPVGKAGSGTMDQYYPADLILKRVHDWAGADLVPVKGRKGAGPARCYRVGSGLTTIGVISAISRHFCDGCNRVRLTAKGELVLCLGQEETVSLREPLRAGGTDEELQGLIRTAIDRKPMAHDFITSGNSGPATEMSSLGG